MKTTICSLALCLCALFHFQILAQNNTVMGTNAGNGTSSAGGMFNSAFGYNAGDVLNSSSSENTLIGASAGKMINIGGYNSIIGSWGGSSLTSGSFNAFIGHSAGYSVTTAQQNTLIGYYAGGAITSNSWNTCVGAHAGKKITGASNTCIGYYSGFNNVAGANNVFLGANAGYNELGSDKLYIENSVTSIPLIYGDFAADKLGINSLPVSTNGNVHTLSVGGTIHATGIYVNGQSLTDAGFEFWTKVGNNVWNNTGNVGIGTPLTYNPNNYKLGVNGKLGAKEVQIENSSWPDYVFQSNYDLITLPELEKYIKQNGHLPEIPSAQEVETNGILVGEMNAKLLQKIEELTLYIIEMKKEIELLKKANK